MLGRRFLQATGAEVRCRGAGGIRSQMFGQGIARWSPLPLRSQQLESQAAAMPPPPKLVPNPRSPPPSNRGETVSTWPPTKSAPGVIYASSLARSWIKTKSIFWHHPGWPLTEVPLEDGGGNEITQDGFHTCAGHAGGVSLVLTHV